MRKFIYPIWISHKFGHNDKKNIEYSAILSLCTDYINAILSIILQTVCKRIRFYQPILQTGWFRYIVRFIKIWFSRLSSFFLQSLRINQAISVSVSARVRNIARGPLDLTVSSVAKIFNIKLDWKSAKVYKVRARGRDIMRALYECLMALEYSRAAAAPDHAGISTLRISR